MYYLFVISGVLLKVGIRAQNLTRQREYYRVVVRFRILVPPSSSRELAEAYQVNPAAPLSEELASPLVEHFIKVQFDISLGSVEDVLELLFSRRLVVAPAHAVKELAGLLRLSPADSV